ncbi:argininosuccinate lyase [Rhodohalobacter sp. 8-1]|uniref:argininosuccinate lyase n=1 Tax=Rhodohalobacter sp. 8-1 TaxID=3131972 RepID=UPI0030EEE807
MSKLWQKNSADTQSDIAKKVEAFTVGNDYELDQELVPYDVNASKVHAAALEKAGILTESELAKLKNGLSDILSLWEKGEFEITVQDEDMHTAIENHLVEKLGDLGKKIHTGRSRNDQVLTAMRLYEKDRLKDVISAAGQCTNELLKFAKAGETVPMPGFTHTRKAMLSSVALWAGGFAEMLKMQGDASSGVLSLVDRSPLGSAAGFGTTIDIDRDFEAEKLGFAKPLVCSTTSQLSRGWVELQYVQYLCGLTAVLNRLAADIIQYSGEISPYFTLDDAVCTGSSIMPQKKNPDLAELIRGRHSANIGHAATLQSLTMNLNSGYHRDLQLTKEPVLKAVRNTLESLAACTLLVKSVSINKEELQKACSAELFAAEEAYKLVKEDGMSFRDAYRKIKESSGGADIDPHQKLKESTHLGSTGNPGLERI